MLGMPQALGDNDIDQDLPLEVDDEYISIDGINPPPEGHVSMIAAANADFKLTKIVANVCKSIYPVKGYQNPGEGSSKSYSVSYNVVRGIENDLQSWTESLPPDFLPGGEAPPHILR